MKRLWEKRVYLMIGASIILFLVVSILSFVSIRQLQGNARVVNYDGIVRGATQKLMKMELQNAHSGNVDETARDNLRNRLDRILYALDTGKGEDTPAETLSTVAALPDETHSGMIKALLVKWSALKDEIDNVRRSAVAGNPDTTTLYAMSEEYFTLANDTVFAAEDYSEGQVSRTTRILIGINVVFIALIAVAGFFIVRGTAVSRRADMLGKIAYIDPLTNINNRASCERIIARMKETPPNGTVAVLMFDMNNLKLTNDLLGHQNGDQIIVQFSKIVAAETKDYGFIGRYGGDEFLGIFENTDKAKVDECLAHVNERIASYNATQLNDLGKISFAVGVTVGLLAEANIDDMIYTADRDMYANKREMKKRNGQ